MTSLAVFLPAFPLTFLLWIALARAKGELLGLRELMTTPWLEAAAEMSIVRALARPEYLCAWMFCSDQKGQPCGDQGREERRTYAEVPLLSREDPVGANTLVEEARVLANEQPGEVLARDVSVGHFRGAVDSQER